VAQNNRIHFIAYTDDNKKVSGTLEFSDNHIKFKVINSEAEFFFNGEEINFGKF